MVASPPLICKSTIEFVNINFIPDNYVIDKLSYYILFHHNPFVFVVIFLSNYLYCVYLNFSEEFDKMLTAL